MNPDRYSPDLHSRFQATITEDGTELGQRWPKGCVGAPTAFLVLLGPSMGGNRAGEAVALGGTNRPRCDTMTIGRDVQTFNVRRRAVWTRLCAEILGSETYVPRITSLMNLDWQHSTQEQKIPQQYLTEGFKDYVWPLLNYVRPRIICVLTNRVWDTIIPQIEQCHSSRFQLPLSVTDRRGKLPSRLPLIFRLPNYQFQTLLIKPHNHPSRGLSYDQCSIIGRACQYFLNKLA